MKYQIITHNQIIGCHQWPNAPKEYEYLRYKHRHVFVIRCKFDVSHTDREIEINDMQDFIQQQIQKNFETRNFGLGVDFGFMSCEEIGEWCINYFKDCVECEVLEDGFGGAIVRK